MSRKVLVVGAGVAGINAAINLAKNDIAATLVETRNHIGGRCFSFIEPTTGDEIDNGQHIFIGAYENFFQLLFDLGTLQYLKPQFNFNINYIDANNSARLSSKLHSGKLPLALALLNFRKLNLKSKFGIIKLIANANKIILNENLSCKDLLSKFNQTNLAITYFWEPLILATLNQSVENSPANLFLEVLKKMFANIDNAKIYFSTVGLSRLFIPVQNYLESHNSQLILNTHIAKIIVDNDKITGCFDKNGNFYSADAMILAVPFDNLSKILSSSGLGDFFNYNFEYSPIISLYFWTHTKLNVPEINALIGTKSHWLFNKSIISQNPSSKHYLYSITISNAKSFLSFSHSEIIDLIISELISLKVIKSKNEIFHTKLLFDKKATISLNYENVNKRPKITTNFRNLFLCGDWVATGLPATIEGAALSGKIAAHEVIQYLKNL